MKHLISLLSFFFSLSVFSQTVQPCVVLEYNERLKKTPLPNVMLRVKNAGEALSDEKGECSLRFRTMKPGDKVVYSAGNISREGYEVFNKDALEQWTLTGSKTPYRIVMCRSERFKKIRDNYEAAMSKNYREQRDREQAKLKKEREADRISEEEYKLKLQEAQDEYDRQLKAITEQADKFARIDLSEMNEIEAKALELLQQGDIEEAIRVYESLNLAGKKRQNADNRNMASNTIYKMWEGILEFREENKRINESIKKQIDIYSASGGKANRHKADSLYYTAAMADTTDIGFLGDYHSYANQRNKKNEAQQVACIIFNHYLNEYKYAPDEGIYKRFENIDEAFAYVKHHKYSLECLEKAESTDRHSYIFTIRGKYEYTFSLIDWMKKNDLLSTTSKKEIISDISRYCKEHGYTDRDILIYQVELGDSTNAWSLFKDIYKNGHSNVAEIKLLSMGHASSKERISFFRSMEKIDKKKYIEATQKLQELQDIHSYKPHIFEVNEDGTTLSTTRTLFASWWEDISSISRIASNYENTLYCNWRESTPKKKLLYENKIKTIIEFKDKIEGTWNNFKTVYSTDSIVYSTDSINIDLINPIVVRISFWNWNNKDVMRYIADYYGKIGDKQKCEEYRRLYLYDAAEATLMDYLEKGDTISAVQYSIELAEKAKPKGKEDNSNHALYEYAQKLYNVFSLAVRIGNSELAEEYAEKAINAYETLGHNYWRKSIYNKLGDFYKTKELWDKAVNMLVLGNSEYHYKDIAEIYWEHLHDAPNALKYLQKILDEYDKDFEEFEDFSVISERKRDDYINIINYMHNIYISAHEGSEHDWINYLRNQLRIYDSYLLYQKYVIDNNAHILRRMILSSYANMKDSISCVEFLDERAERMKQIYEKNPTETTLYMYGDAVGYDYYNFYRQIDNTEMAEHYALKAAEIYKKLYEEYGNLPPLANMYRELIYMFENKNDYKKSLTYSEPAISYYEKLADFDYLLVYSYIAKAWAKYNLNMDDYESYQDELQKGSACYEKLEQKYRVYTSKFVIRQRIEELTSYTNLCKSQPSDDVSDVLKRLYIKIWRLFKNAKIDEATELAEKAYAIDDSNETSKAYLADCYNSKAYEFAYKSDYNNAHNFIDKAISLLPDAAEFYDSKGEILLMQGKNDDALAVWKKVLELKPNFLDDYPDGTNLSNGLKGLGLIR